MLSIIFSIIIHVDSMMFGIILTKGIGVLVCYNEQVKEPDGVKTSVSIISLSWT